MSVVSVSMPERLVERIDELVEAHDYSGRSELVRKASRKLAGEFTDRELEGRQRAAVITVLYPYGSAEIETGLTNLRHEHSSLICSNSHSCIGDETACLEMFVLEGALREVSMFARAVETVSEEIRVEHSLYPLKNLDEDQLHFV